MDQENARNELRQCLRQYLEEVHSINVQRPFRCLSPEHRDEHPSMSFDKAHNRVHCFACGFSADIIDLIKQDNNLMTDKEAFNWGYKRYAIDVDKTVSRHSFSSYRQSETCEPESGRYGKTDFSQYFKECFERIENSPGIEYLRKRGFHVEVIRRFGIGYDPAFGHGTGSSSWRAIIVPTGEDSFVARNIDVTADDDERKRDRVRKVGSSRPFNLSALSEDTSVFIVEGEIDALSVMECGGQAVGLGSTANVNGFLRYVDVNNVRPLHPLQISLDNDDDGRKATQKLGVELKKRGIAFVERNISGEYKDPNEVLVKDRFFLTGVIRDTERNEEENKRRKSSEYFKTSGAGSMVDFIREVERNRKSPPISTGFLSLDDCLGGGLYEGLYILGAISSLGKTDFVLQIADNIARGDWRHDGRDVLIIALEMSRFELMARSISRETFEAVGDVIGGNAKTTREILNGQGYEHFNDADLNTIRNAETAYRRYAHRLFFVEGLDDIGWTQIRKAVEKHIDITGQVPVVFIDYLQLLSSNEASLTDKQNVDKTVLELKRISRDFRTPVVVVSSFNRMGYKNSAAMEAFKESGAIEYSADVLIGLQFVGAGDSGFDIDAAKRQNPRQIEAIILKHRNGRTGDRLRFSFFPAYNFFDEELDGNVDPEKANLRREFVKAQQEAAAKDAGSLFLTRF